MIFMVTPTYNRPTQVPDMIRLCQTLMNVKYFHWMVVEDGNELSQDVVDILNRCSVNSTHLRYKTPDWQSDQGTGADQRNYAMKWLREHYAVGQVPGVVYFGDDDNTYDLRLFEEVSMYVVIYFCICFICDRLLPSNRDVSNLNVMSFDIMWIDILEALLEKYTNLCSTLCGQVINLLYVTHRHKCKHLTLPQCKILTPSSCWFYLALTSTLHTPRAPINVHRHNHIGI